jgi:hypothetical protein
MNPTALKSFAPVVRTQLMEAVTRKLDDVLTADTLDLRQAAAQVSALRKEATKDRQCLLERVAYTWFNRLAALRFVDARGWHPFRARVLTPATTEETQLNMDLSLGCERFHPRRSATPGRLRVMCLPSDPVSPALTPLSLLAGASVLAYAGLWALDLKAAALVFALAALASQVCQRCRRDDFHT